MFLSGLDGTKVCMCLGMESYFEVIIYDRDSYYILVQLVCAFV